MADLVYNPQEVADALGRVLSQFRSSGRLLALYGAILRPWQTLEDMHRDLYSNRWADLNAEGVQLDNLGAIVGQPREGRDDATYLPWIQARILVNRSSGKPDEMILISQLVTAGLAGTTYTEGPDIWEALYLPQYPGGDAGALEVFKILSEAKSAGVRLFVYYDTPPSGDLFAWASGDIYEVDAARGWADDTASVGGRWSGVVG